MLMAACFTCRYEVSSCEVIWAIKHDTISATFFDAGAAQFFLPHLQDSSDPEKVAVSKRWTYHVAGGCNKAQENL